MSVDTQGLDCELADLLFGVVGEEIARNEYHPGAMAKAVAFSDGNEAKIKSAYIRFRVEELGRQVEREHRKVLLDRAKAVLQAKLLQQALEDQLTQPAVTRDGMRGEWVGEPQLCSCGYFGYFVHAWGVGVLCPNCDIRG